MELVYQPKKTRRSGPHFAGGDSPSSILLRIVDGSLAGCVFLVPLLLGGNHALGRVTLCVLALSAAAAWTASRCRAGHDRWRVTPVLFLLAISVAVVVIQIVPLPSSVCRQMMPSLWERLPLWNSQGDSSSCLGVWQTLSMTPDLTRSGLAVLLSYCLVFVVTLQRLRKLEDVERLLRWIAVAAFAMAAFGLLQYATSNGKFFWFLEHPQGTTSGIVKGSFVNRNHFAQFLALGLGPLVWWIGWSRADTGSRGNDRARQATRSAWKRYRGTMLLAALTIVVSAGLLSFSRGGVGAMALALAIGTTVAYRAAVVDGRFVAAMIAAGIVVGVTLTLVDGDRLYRRFEEASSLEMLEKTNGRLSVWKATVASLPDHLLLGTGVGSFRYVYPIHFDEPDNGYEFSHAENGYLQVALETGLVGLGLVICGLGCCAFWCFRALRYAPSQRALLCAGAVFGAIVASAAHSVVDFVWYMPGCMVIAVIFAGCACRLSQWAVTPEGQERTVRLGRPLAAAALAAILGVGAWMVVQLAGPVSAQPHWDQYLVLSFGEAWRMRLSSRGYKSASPVRETAFRVQQQIHELEEVLQAQPGHGRAHLRLAGLCLSVFDTLQLASDNPMTLASLSDAAAQSSFPSFEARQAWVRRVTGDRFEYLTRAWDHAREALRCCPLEGEGYVCLGRMAGLAGPGSKKAYLDQALAVRPFDGRVLYAVALETWLAGQSDLWLDYLKRSYRQGPLYQENVIATLVNCTSVEGIGPVTQLILQEFQPDLGALRCLHDVAKRRTAAEQLTCVIRARAEAAQARAQECEGPEAARLWTEAGSLHRQLRNTALALDCLQKAIGCDSSHYDAHFQFALALIEQDRYPEAQTHLLWCRQRSVGNRSLENQLKAVLKNRSEDTACRVQEAAAVR